MSDTLDPDLAARLRQESEATRNQPYPEGSRPTRPNRSKVYSVRLSAAEQSEIEKVAAAQHLPASTLVRAWILDRLDHERSA